MRRLIIFFTLGLFYLNASSQYHFTIDMNAPTLLGKKVYFSIFNNDNFIPLRSDSIIIKNEIIKITGQLNQKSHFASFLIMDKGKYISTNFIVDSGYNKINLDFNCGDKSLKLRSETKGNFIFDEMQNIFNRKVGQTKVNGYYQISSDLSKQYLNEQRKGLERYPNVYASVLYLYRLGKFDYTSDYTKAILGTLATFNDDVKNSDLGKKLYQDKTALLNNQNSARIGHKSLEFSVMDINNRLFSNTDLKGENYLIVFSATWCGPCQKQLPMLKALYQKYKDKGLKVVYFNNDDDVKRWKTHVLVNKLNWINVSERLKPAMSKIQRSFGVYAVPTCLLVDKTGIIVYNSDQNDTALDQLEGHIKRTID